MIGSDQVLRTPLIRYRPGKAQIRGQIFLKPENLQPFGSYKIRGIVTAAAQADPARLREGLFAYSAGNMAQAVAFVAKLLNVPCTIYVPEAAPEVKKNAIRKLGATLVELPVPEFWAQFFKLRPKDQDQGIFIHPVFTPGLLDGYGNIGKEIVADLSDVDAVVIPYGSGGLTLGITQAIRQLKPNVAIYASETETAAPLRASLRAQRLTDVERIPSFVDGIGAPFLLPEVFPMMQSLLTDSIVVTLDQIKAAIAELYHQHHMVAEGAGGAALAAAIHLSQTTGYRNIVGIISGGNISTDIMKEIISTS